MQKILFYFGIAILLMLACKQEPKPHAVFILDDTIEVHFGRKMSVELLDSIRAAVGLKGVSLSYPEVKYDNELLTKLEIKVEIGGQGGSAATNFVYRGRPFGFRIDHLKSFQPTLTLGELERK
ncbi:MAG: hypothetical protein IPM34_14025 [Saprospiraceae bacterium]|nr:hypothetical protein [Saprospiraceae bacterium]